MARNYVHDFLIDEGRAYRLNFFNQQYAGGEHPLLVYPTPEGLFRTLERYEPESVLEFGCGWGRMLEWLHERYEDGIEIQGCDVCDEFLVAAQFSAYYLDVFKLDIVRESADRQWDVLFCRGVFQYFTDQEIGSAIRNLLAMAKKKILIWEFPHICERISSVRPVQFPGSKIELYPIPPKREYWK